MLSHFHTEAPVLRTRDPSSTWKESKQLHALAPRISHIDEADEHEKLAVDLFPLTDAGAFDWRTFFFNDTVDNAAMDGAMKGRALVWENMIIYHDSFAFSSKSLVKNRDERY